MRKDTSPSLPGGKPSGAAEAAKSEKKPVGATQAAKSVPPRHLKGAPRNAEIDCDEGDGLACLDVGERAKARGQLEVAVRGYARACQFRKLLGCREAFELYQKLKNTDQQIKVGQKGCQRGEATLCRKTVDLLQKQANPAQHRAEIQRLQARACRFGDSASCQPGTASPTPESQPPPPKPKAAPKPAPPKQAPITPVDEPL